MIKLALPPSTKERLVKEAHASGFFRHARMLEQAVNAKSTEYYRDGNDMLTMFEGEDSWVLLKFAYGKMTPVGEFDSREKAKSFMQK